MLTKFTSKSNTPITDAMRERAILKLSSIEKYFRNEETEMVANILLDVYTDHQKVEVTINTPVGLLRAEVKAPDYYSALDTVVDKLEDQIRRQKTRMSRKHRDSLSVAFLEEIKREELEPFKQAEPVRTKEILADRMDLDEAIMKMEMLNHTFFIYTDDETNEIAVVYKRFDGGYGLLEVEADQ